jgi:transcription elongation GreA/GreB family factor
MNKTALLQQILAQLEAELALSELSARAAHAEATHEQNKAENKYDTRALEASYLAHGQSLQRAETEQARQQFEAMALRAFGPGEPIDLGAFVEVEERGESAFYFIGPRAGGTEVICEKKTVLVITPHSPLGRQLFGKKQGERVRIEVGRNRQELRIVAVV